MVRRYRRRSRIYRVGRTRMQEYSRYLSSPQWRAFRAAWWSTYDRTHKIRRCYVCGISQAEHGRHLELHHRTYERLGKERFGDLVPICGGGPQTCHAKITRAWRARARTGLTMTLWELTDHHRELARLTQVRG